jgi:hypothetical protein
MIVSTKDPGGESLPVFFADRKGDGRRMRSLEVEGMRRGEVEPYQLFLHNQLFSLSFKAFHKQSQSKI